MKNASRNNRASGPMVLARDIGRTYPGQAKPAVSGIGFSLEEGEILSLVGPSGCGKSTTLRLIAGLEPVDQGTLHIGGAEATTLSPAARKVGWVPQNYGLFPHMSVGNNVAYGQKVRGIPASERKQAVADAMKLVQITEHADRKPADLSGGQRQRVAIARAIASNPRVLLLDEPLAALDPQLRDGLRSQLSRILRESGRSAIIVTHDQREAMALGDKVAVLNSGRMVQCDSPTGIWENPASDFVANFVSRGRMLTGTLDGHGRVHLPGGTFLALEDVDLRGWVPPRGAGEQVRVIIRPHDFTVAPGDAAAGFGVDVVESEYVGNAVIASTRLGEEPLQLEFPAGTAISGRMNLAPVPGAISVRPLQDVAAADLSFPLPALPRSGGRPANDHGLLARKKESHEPAAV